MANRPAFALRRAIQRNGESIILRRRIGTTSTYQEVPLRAFVRGYKPEEMFSGSIILFGDRQVTIAGPDLETTAWPWPPKGNDMVVIAGTTTTVKGVEARRVNDQVVAYILQVRG